MFTQSSFCPRKYKIIKKQNNFPINLSQLKCLPTKMFTVNENHTEPNLKTISFLYRKS